MFPVKRAGAARARRGGAAGLLAALLLAGCATAPVAGPGMDAEPDWIPILERFEDARSLGAGQIEALTRARAPEVRGRALLALGRLREPATVGVVLAGLDDPEPAVRAWAAFAAGQFGLGDEPLDEPRRALAEARLLERLSGETDPEVLGALYEALGKVGGAASLAPLWQALHRPDIDRVTPVLALGLLARSSQGGLRHPRAPAALTRLLMGAPEARLRHAAALGLVRMGDREGLVGLRLGIRDPDPEVRAVCALGLAAMGEPADLARLGRLLADPDEAVAAEAGRGLAWRAAGCKEAEPCPAMGALVASETPWRPGPAAAIAAAPLRGGSAIALLRAQHDALAAIPDRSPAALGVAGRVQCLLALAHDRAGGEPLLVRGCGLGQVGADRRAMLEARGLAGRSGGEALGMAALADRGSPGVRAAALRALAELGTPEAGRMITAHLADPEPAVAAAAAEAARRLKLAEAGPALAARVARAAPGDGEAMLAALSALAALGHRPGAAAARARLDDPDPRVRFAAARTLAALTGERPAVAGWPPGPYAGEPLPPRPFVRLETARGTIRIQLFASESPMAVRAFLYRVRRGLYDGLDFHRVMPGRFAQGGDPRGDGSGGADYAVRCEINRRRFVAGSVGMAHSGPDTGGVQFYIALSPQPHLDGRYTQLGQVVEGLEVARGLVEGDPILSVTVEDETPAI